MIKYNLKCVNKHEFESWFSESKEFDRLKKKKLIECIFCHTKNVEKSIMSPRILNSRDLKNQNEIPNIKMKNFKNDLQNLRKFVEKNFEYVGDKFSEKVRDVYYDKKSKKSIYGIVSPEEREELSEEGIDLLSIPWVSKDN